MQYDCGSSDRFSPDTGSLKRYGAFLLGMFLFLSFYMKRIMRTDFM
nr:MAG TPA: hypothetical protein [Caudoviricetes sp.]